MTSKLPAKDKKALLLQQMKNSIEAQKKKDVERSSFGEKPVKIEDGNTMIRFAGMQLSEDGESLIQPFQHVGSHFCRLGKNGKFVVANCIEAITQGEESCPICEAYKDAHGAIRSSGYSDDEKAIKIEELKNCRSTKRVIWGGVVCDEKGKPIEEKPQLIELPVTAYYGVRDAMSESLGDAVDPIDPFEETENMPVSIHRGKGANNQTQYSVQSKFRDGYKLDLTKLKAKDQESFWEGLPPLNGLTTRPTPEQAQNCINVIRQIVGLAPISTAISANNAIESKMAQIESSNSIIDDLDGKADPKPQQPKNQDNSDSDDDDDWEDFE